MKIKICTHCKQEKPIALFYKSKKTQELRQTCIPCIKEFNKKQYEAHKEKIKKAVKEYCIKNKELVLEKKRTSSKKYRATNPSKVLETQRKYREANIELVREKARLYMCEKYKNNIEYKIKVCISSRLRQSLKANKKNKPWCKYVDYSINDLMVHLEKLFTDGMCFDNYGEWEIDHVRPIASYNLTNEKELTECWKIENLQPLWRKDNRMKSDKLDYQIRGIA